jgi:hypothetical protein
VEEQVAMFLLAVGHNERFRVVDLLDGRERLLVGFSEGVVCSRGAHQ